LSHEDGARLTESTDGRSILPGHAFAPARRTRRSRPLLDINNVLNAHRNSMQRAPIATLTQLCPETIRLVSCRLPINQHPGPDTPFPAIDLCQAFFQKFARSDLPVP